MSPGHNESGGKRRSGETMRGDVWLADALIEAAWAAARPRTPTWRRSSGGSPGPAPTASARRKPPSAVGHKILITAYHIMATPGEVYRELGGDYFTRRDNPDRRRNRLVAQLKPWASTSS